MLCSDWVLEWELLRLFLHLCELAHLLATVGLVPHSSLIPADEEEVEVVHQKTNLVVELSKRSPWEPISAVPNSVSSPVEDGVTPNSPASGMNQTDIQVYRRKHWT